MTSQVDVSHGPGAAPGGGFHAEAHADSQAQLRALIGGYRLSQALYVATRLGIPDLLSDGPREIEELAHATKSHAPSLRRVLLALAAAGVLDKIGPDHVALTPVGAWLRADVPGSRRASVLFLLNETHWRPWGHLLHTVRTGENAFAHAHGAPLFDYLAAHPEEASLFNAGMAGNSPAHARLVAASYDFSGMRLIVYILRNIVHDWRDDQAVAVLATCRRAMADGARLILVERHVPDDPREGPIIFHADLEMLVNVGGQERTTQEYAALLARGGLTLTRTISLGRADEAMGHHLIEAQIA
jgi:hypothetical protein